MAVRCAISLITVIAIIICGSSVAQYPDQVLLKDVQVLTLRQGHMTAGRRSSPVPQLKCVGGTSHCEGFVPQVVQCYNRGSDGNDIQWECKTDMDNAYRFGRTDVTCEGYSYPDDPFILKGSCGLEYTIDLTKEGYEKRDGGQRHVGGGSYYSSKNNNETNGWGVGVALIAIVIIVYIVYTNCLATPSHINDSTHPHSDRQPYGPPPPYTPRDQGSFNSQPPPPGFKPEHTSGMRTGASYRGGTSSSSDQYYGSSTYTHDQQQQQQANSSSTGGGFWTGAAAGGLLGYLFGSSNRGGGMYRDPPYTRGRREWDSNPGGSWFNSGGSSSSYYTRSSSSGFGGSSSGTRTASGFGGTSRR